MPPVSLDPPLMMFCVGCENPSAKGYRDCTLFGINVLTIEQKDLASRFAGTATSDQWAGLEFRVGEVAKQCRDQLEVPTHTFGRPCE
jgi:flavin reductase (DIM6/NTAB) family NADH-FMN oxidoreductase RutF